MGCADPSAHGHLQVHNAGRPMPSPHVKIMLPSAQRVLSGHSEAHSGCSVGIQGRRNTLRRVVMHWGGRGEGMVKGTGGRRLLRGRKAVSRPYRKKKEKPDRCLNDHQATNLLPNETELSPDYRPEHSTPSVMGNTF